MATKKDYLRIMASTNRKINQLATGRTKEDEYMQNRRDLRALFGVKEK